MKKKRSPKVRGQEDSQRKVTDTTLFSCQKTE